QKELVASFRNSLHLLQRRKQMVVRSSPQAHAGHAPQRSGACLADRVSRPAPCFSARTACVGFCSLSLAPIRAAAAQRKTRNQFLLKIDTDARPCYWLVSQPLCLWTRSVKMFIATFEPLTTSTYSREGR